MDIIIFQVDENRKRIAGAPDWKGCFHPDNKENDLWLYIYDNKGKPVFIERGEIIHYSYKDCDISGDYIIKKACNGIYQVEQW